MPMPMPTDLFVEESAAAIQTDRGLKLSPSLACTRTQKRSRDEPQTKTEQEGT